jgi:hypothetical protein
LKIARNILLIFEAVILTAMVAFAAYIIAEFSIEGGLVAIAWLYVLIIFAFVSVNLVAIGIIATVLTSKLNRAYYNTIDIESSVETKKCSIVPGILGIVLPIATLLVYFVYPIIFIV